jgi:cytosine/adenosine deaminase-related metal-dependent hydrolase
LIVFDTSSPGMLGWNDPVAAAMMHAGSGDIEHVLVDGQFRKRDFQLTHLDYANLRRRLLQSAERIQRFVGDDAAAELRGAALL